jgi:hypothetical protein
MLLFLAQLRRIPRGSGTRCTRTGFAARECSSLLATPLRVHRIFVVNSPQNLSVFEFISRVFTSSGATQYFC